MFLREVVIVSFVGCDHDASFIRFRSMSFKVLAINWKSLEINTITNNADLC